MSDNDNKFSANNLHEIYFEFAYVPLPDDFGIDPKTVDEKLASEVKARIPGEYLPATSEVESATDYNGNRAVHVIQRTVMLHATNVPLHRVKLIPVLREAIATMRNLWKVYIGGELYVIEGGVIIDLPGYHISSCCSMHQTHTLPGVRTTGSRVYHVIQKKLELPDA